MAKPLVHIASSHQLGQKEAVRRIQSPELADVRQK